MIIGRYFLLLSFFILQYLRIELICIFLNVSTRFRKSAWLNHFSVVMSLLHNKANMYLCSNHVLFLITFWNSVVLWSKMNHTVTPGKLQVYSRGETIVQVDMAPIYALRYALPILIALGGLGNVFIIVTSCRQNMRKRTYTTYLLFLALSDIATTIFSGLKILVFVFWGMVVELLFHCIW